MQKLMTAGKKSLVIVAHPDDETIWLGGLIMAGQNTDWTIFSLCRASDQDRAPKFKKVARHLKAKPIITDLEDEGKLTVRQTIPLIKQLILAKIKAKKFNYIFTHGKNGEYGHPRHIGAHLAIKELIDQKQLSPEAVYFFNYKKAAKNKLPQLTYKKNSDLIFRLSKKEFRRKKRIMTNIYGFDPEGIDANLCPNPEAFLIKKIK